MGRRTACAPHRPAPGNPDGPVHRARYSPATNSTISRSASTAATRPASRGDGTLAMVTGRNPLVQAPECWRSRESTLYLPTGRRYR
jgi:hypothetical protein